MMHVLGRPEPSLPGPDSVVTGAAWVQTVARPGHPSRLVVEDITFAPGSHTIWHSHPYGQLLIVTAGAGWLQTRGNPAIPIRTGDTVWIEPTEEHWHGSAPDTVLRHLSIQEHQDGQEATLAEPLTPGTYPPNPLLTEELRP
jgi:quercetin dioxygenase-like cupin family protein